MAQGPCRRRRRSNRAGGVAEGARALPAESEPRRGQESLLLRHGRNAARWVWAPVLRHLRSRPDVPRGAIGARQRSQRGGREFLERYQLREEFQQCDGFQADDGRPLCDGRDRSRASRAIIATHRENTWRSAARSCSSRAKATRRMRDLAPSADIRPPCCGSRVGERLRKVRTLTRRATFRLGTLQDYAAGRSNGCTSWSQSDAAKIIPMMQEPSTLYIYPESGDIAAVAQAVKAGKSPSRAGSYWNASCLREIRSPKFWPKETLEPVLIQYKKNHPAPPPQPLPICKGQ